MIFSAQKIGELPATVRHEKNAGIAGAFSGVIDHELIIVGGTNFPEKKPWESGNKIFYNKIYAFGIGEDKLKAIYLIINLFNAVFL